MAVERIRIRRDAAATWTSENPTLGLGEMGIETDTGRVKVGDGATAWITLDYAYAKADRVVSKSADYTITGAGDDNIVNVTTAATDRTITLPAGSGMAAGDTLEVHKVDSGTGKVTVARASTDTIDGVTAIDIDSQYDMARLRWTGAYWTLTEYKDHGSAAAGEWQRYADGSMTQQGSVTTSSAGVATWTLPKPYIDDSYDIRGITEGGGSGESEGRVVQLDGAKSSTSIDIRVWRSSGIAGVNAATISTTGRWRA